MSGRGNEREEKEEGGKSICIGIGRYRWVRRLGVLKERHKPLVAP